LSGGDAGKLGTSEADAMHSFVKASLKRAGQTCDVRLECDSMNTVENALKCRELLLSIDSLLRFNVTIVTNEFHAPRARLLFRAVLPCTSVACVKAASGDANQVIQAASRELQYLPLLPSYLRMRYNFSDERLPTSRDLEVAKQELILLKKVAEQGQQG